VTRLSPYGSWTSPITSDFLVSKAIGLAGASVRGGDLYWTEGRPTEGGRQVIVRRSPDGTVTDMAPPPYNMRSRVHEYGGGASAIGPDGTIYFSNFADQNLYAASPGGEPQKVTDHDGWRYADGVVDADRNRLICVREDHTGPGEAVNNIVAVDLTSGESTVLVEGHDFFAAPRLSPDGRLCWLAWDHPNMPWNGCVLRAASFDGNGAVIDVVEVAGGDAESIAAPAWSPDGALCFASDRSGFWNLYRWDGESIQRIHAQDADFAQPAWTFGERPYAFADAQTIVAVYCVTGSWRLATIDIGSGMLRDIDTPYSTFSGIRVHGGRVYTVAASPTRMAEVVAIDLATGAVEVFKRSLDLALDERYLSIPQAIEFPTENGLTAHGFYYPPRNADFEAPAGQLPPLLVVSHGGPTSATTTQLSLAYQYWTSRGLAIFDVNYGGSTGYGRAYWERLLHNWGIVDIDDCCNGALHLAKQGLADPARLAIRGGSAGGYTTLGALAFRDVFAAGASHFGVGDLAALAAETHKFESRYLDSLIGPYPEAADVYQERSPLAHLDRFDRPIIFFQGLDDRVVPPDQAESMVAALTRKGVPVAYIAYEGEGHGFRSAANIKRTADAELYFYGKVFGFEPAGDIESTLIANL
jgi:dipeptidyl aminopeptidase/acylaminoacyl peptidase